MACNQRYAEAWQFAGFWCIAQLVSGVDGGGAVPPALPLSYLTDTSVNFLSMGARANVGMVLYNLTSGTSGLITGVTDNTLTATGVTWYDGDSYRVVLINAAVRGQIEHWLDVVAGEIYAALGSVDACNCTLSSWGSTLLAQLNIIAARMFYDCPCAPSLSSEDKARYSDFINTRLQSIRTGEIDVCDGATGSAFPAGGWAEMSLTEWNAARIILNDESRSVP